MAEIIIVRPEVINAADKAALRKAGIVVVEAANPDEVRFIRATTAIPADRLLSAALKSLRHADDIGGNRLFVKLCDEYVAQALDDPAPTVKPSIATEGR